MSQPTGYPGGGVRLAKDFMILSGVGDPNVSATPDVKGCRSLNAAYFRVDAPDASHWLYQCTTAALFVNGTLTAAAAWTAK